MRKEYSGLLGQVVAESQLLQAIPAWLTAGEAKQRLRHYGPNSLAQESLFAGLLALLRFFANPLVVILLQDNPGIVLRPFAIAHASYQDCSQQFDAA